MSKVFIASIFFTHLNTKKIKHMDKKELRKELELLLVKTIEEVLSKKNSESSKKIRKTTYDSSKTIAKKFYKSLKEKAKPAAKKAAKKPVKSKAVKKTKAPVKKAKSKK